MIVVATDFLPSRQSCEMGPVRMPTLILIPARGENYFDWIRNFAAPSGRLLLVAQRGATVQTSRSGMRLESSSVRDSTRPIVQKQIVSKTPETERTIIHRFLRRADFSAKRQKPAAVSKVAIA